MPQRSAGIVLYRRGGPTPEVLLVHMGGPYWAKKDLGAWSIPKGLIDGREDPLAAARREFSEETGGTATGEAQSLGDFRQPSGKVITAFAVAGDFDLSTFRSSTFAMEWPPRSGKTAEFPEADRAAWFTLAEAEGRIVSGQRPILAALAEWLGSVGGRGGRP
jgi:predicted NUDIX family NTP pyrophosphohydrolase